MKRLVFLAGLVLFFSCMENKSEPKLGRINIQVSCNEAAQKLFQEGLAYLHSFEYLDARELIDIFDKRLYFLSTQEYS